MILVISENYSVGFILENSKFCQWKAMAVKRCTIITM